MGSFKTFSIIFHVGASVTVFYALQHIFSTKKKKTTKKTKQKKKNKKTVNSL